MNKPNLYASSATLDGIRKLTVKFYGGSVVTLNPDGPNRWTVSTERGLTGLHVVKKRDRYRLEKPNA